MATYSAIRNQLDSGDVVLFSFQHAFTSSIIKRLSKSKWTHIGIVYRNEETGRLEHWEAVGRSPVADITHGMMDEGVTAVYLSEKIAYHLAEDPKIDIAVRHLDIRRTPAMLEEMRAVWQQYKDHKYINFRSPADIAETLKAFYDGLGGSNVEDTDTLFCSEFVTLIYQRIGLLPAPPAGLPANEYTPGDFAEKSTLTFLNGSLGPEIPIKGI